MFLMSMLTLIFLMYANNFVINQRKRICFKYDSRYGEKHLRSVILFRTCCSVSRISSIKYCRRLSFGQLLFMSINKIIGIKQPNLSDYPFDSLCNDNYVITAFGTHVFIIHYK